MEAPPIRSTFNFVTRWPISWTPFGIFRAGALTFDLTSNGHVNVHSLYIHEFILHDAIVPNPVDVVFPSTCSRANLFSLDVVSPSSLCSCQVEAFPTLANFLAMQVDS